MSDKGKIRVSSEIKSSEIKSSEINSDEIKSSVRAILVVKVNTVRRSLFVFVYPPAVPGRLQATCNMVLSGNVPRAAKSAATALGGD